MAKRKKDTESNVNIPANQPVAPAPKARRVTKPRAVKAAAPVETAVSTPDPVQPAPPAAARVETPGVAVTSSPMARTPTNGGVPVDRIAARAYEIYQSRNGSSGDPLQDWLQAERELLTTH